MSTAYVFDREQLLNAARAYVDLGSADTRALRQQEVDGTLAFIGSDAAQKLRVKPSPTSLDAVATPGCKVSAEVARG